MGLNIANRFVILTGRLQGRVRSPVRQVEKEWTIFIRVNNFDRFISPLVHQVAAGLEAVLTEPHRLLATP